MSTAQKKILNDPFSNCLISVSGLTYAINTGYSVLNGFIANEFSNLKWDNEMALMIDDQ